MTFWARFFGGSLACACFVASGTARAQVNLPPPPPPPLTTENPPPPPPPPSGSGGGRDTRRPRPQPREERREAPRSDRPAPAQEERWEPRGEKDWSVRLNPLTFFVGRFSVDVEWLFLPRHALLIAPHFTFPQERATMPARALGFAGTSASGFGAEVGYRHYVSGVTAPEGLFFGPSLLLDSTRPAAGINRVTAYGAAFDVGYQIVMGSGFTMGAGGGLLVIAAKDTRAQFSPRLLFSIGWSF